MGDLGQAVRAFKRAERRRDEEIYRAHLAGSSLRAIALETGLSHESIRVIVERMRSWVAREQKILAHPSHGFTVDARQRDERSVAKRRAHLDWLLNVSESDS